MGLNGGTGTHGFDMIKTPFGRIANTGVATNYWYIHTQDLGSVPDSWNDIKDLQDRVLPKYEGK
jgi:hypothetical protein